MAFCIEEGTTPAILDYLSSLCAFDVGYANIKLIDRVNYEEGNFTATLQLYPSKAAREQSPARNQPFLMGGPIEHSALAEDDIRAPIYARIAELITAEVAAQQAGQ